MTAATIGLRDRKNILLFSIGKSISVLGSSLFSFAVSLHILSVTGSGLSFAITLSLGVLPVILIGPVAGYMADRFNKKSVIILADAVNGLLFLGICLVFGESYPLYIFYLSTFLNGCLTTVFSISIESSKTQLVDRRKLPKINAISKIIDSVSTISGPIAGGMIFAFIDIQHFFLINGLSYIFSAFIESLLMFRSENILNKKQFDYNLIKSIGEAYNFLIRRKDLMMTAFIGIVVNIVFGFSITVPIPFIVNTIFNLSPYQFGIIEGAFPIGIIIGSFCIGPIFKKELEFNTFLTWMCIVLGTIVIFSSLPLLVINSIPNSNIFIFYMVIMVIYGYIVALIDIPYLSVFQVSVEDAYRGRVMSIVTSIVKIINPIALILSGVFLNQQTTFFIIVIGGATLLGFGVALIMRNGSRKIFTAIDK